MVLTSHADDHIIQKACFMEVKLSTTEQHTDTDEISRPVHDATT